MHVTVPRLLVAGLRGGSGKTLLSLGLAASFRSRGVTVAPFKKGPDYIDASWLTRASGRPCRNLDLFLFPPDMVLSSFRHGVEGAELAIVEGNRGLFDGMDAEGTFSSAELAKLLKTPVILSVDVTKTTRTAAAMILGCQAMDPAVNLAGVVLSRTAGSRHESVLRQSVEGITGVRVLGAIPRLPEDIFPERHLGLVPPQETEEADSPLSRVAEVAEKYLDLDGILALAEGADPLEVSPRKNGEKASRTQEERPTGRESARPRVGVFMDSAFQFYYPENLEALREAGAELVEISPLEASQLPQVDALYLGGGFPETLAPGLSQNEAFRRSVREAGLDGLPIYAECGGAIYLGERLHFREDTFPMAGIFPVEYGFRARPQGHGYTILETVSGNPYFSVGETLRGHEFHYTYLMNPEAEGLEFAFRVHRGTGFGGGRDGLKRQNALASYTHIHALGARGWASSLVRAASRFSAR